MSASTTGNVTEEHHNFISIMAIEREKRSARTGIVKKSCSQKSATGLIYKRSGQQQNFVSCRQLHLCRAGPDGDRENSQIPAKLEKAEPLSKTKGTQTDYRESETQTSPWEAPYKLRLQANENPEILSLAKSTWQNGLPAGIHEVQIIKRMRMKRAWLEALPPMDSPENIKIRETITAIIEANEWAFREAEIQSVMDARMELMGRIRKNKIKEKEENTEKRIKRHAQHLSQLRDKQIHKIRQNFSRAVRKLTTKHRISTATPKKNRSDFIARYASAKSDLYGTGIRFSRKNKKPDKTVITRATRVDDSTQWLPVNQPSFGRKQDSKPEELCPRQTRWNDEKLRKLHADLKAIRLNNRNDEKSGIPSLLKRKLKASTLPVTPNTNNQSDNYWENPSLFLQNIIGGRVTQSMMFEGRSRCRELMQELSSTRSNEGSTGSSCHDGEMDDSIRDWDENDGEFQDNSSCEGPDSLEEKTDAEMLYMLSKEDTRLREERRAHGFVLLAERERNRREAEESGTRQLERNRRRELDEMFRQIVKVNQDSVEAYLEDIIKDGIDWVSDEQASRYVVELADKIDSSTSQSLDHDSPAKDEEEIADMVYNLLLPEVDKEIFRQKMQSRQQSYIQNARVAIFNETMESKKEEDDILADEQETVDELSEREESPIFEFSSTD